MWNTLLWIAQAFVALVMTTVGSVKLFLPRERLAKRVHWAASWPREQIKLLGLAEIAGGLGLVIPIATGIAPFLTPIAALCLSVLMVGAIRTHRQLGEGIAGAVAVGGLCLVIAAGRGAVFVH